MPILFFAAAYVAEIIGTVAGFGSSTVFLPMALVFFDFRTALTLVALLHVFGNIGRISFFRLGLDKRILTVFGIPGIAATLVGAALVPYVPQETLKGILGLFLSSYAAAALVKKDLRVEPSVPNQVLGGGLSGFLAGLIGTGGALRGAFLTAFGLPKEKYVATAAAIALSVDATRIPVYFANGFLENRFYWYIPVLFFIALAGSFTGKKVVGRIRAEKFRTVVLLAILLIGLKFVRDWTLLR